LNRLTGTVFGSSVQAGAIHGNVHFHAPEAGSRLPVPQQLPAAPARFAGRSNEFGQLDAMLDEVGPMLAVLTGAGGVGKTALALRWARNVRHRFPDGQLFFDLGGTEATEPADPGEVLGTFLRGLGVAASAVPATLAERAALYRTVTANRSILILADNAFSAAQARIVRAASPSSALVVTSRSRLAGLIGDGARLVEVDPLAGDESISLLTDAVGEARIDREREQAERLGQLCGGLPIALVVAAARLVARPRMSIGQVVSELADETGRLAELSSMEGFSVQASFDAAYRDLDPAAAALYRRLALHPGQDFGFGPIATALLSVRADLRSPVGDPLDVLMQANLLTERGDQRFAFHDLLRLHARQKAETEETPASRDRSLRGFAEWYLAMAGRADLAVTPYRRRIPWQPRTELAELATFENREMGLAWLEAERRNLMAASRAVMASGHADLAWHLSDVMWPLFLYAKHDGDRLEADQRGVTAARVWGNGWAEADMLKRLSRAMAGTGDLAGAEQLARAAIDRYREVGDGRGDLDAQEVLASICRDGGRDAEAAGILTGVLAANRSRGEERNIALTLISLGMLLPSLGRPREAIELLEEARVLHTRLADIDPYNGARVVSGLAAAHLEARAFDHAADLAAEAARRMAALGSVTEQAEALRILGQAEAGRGDIEAARRQYHLAIDVLAPLGSRRAINARDRLAGLVAATGPRAVPDHADGPMVDREPAG
jgi:tetratricopeptide (TPR) repeat protein